MLAASQRGVGLIEILISLLIMSLGVLGVIALQITAKRNNTDSIQQTIAAQLAYDVIERMRSNNSGNGLRTYYDSAPNRVGIIATQPTPVCAINATCNAAELAEHDLWAWEQQLLGASEFIAVGGSQTVTGGMVNPTACINGPVGGISGLYSVTIAWRGGTSLLNDAGVACGLGATDAGGVRLYGDADEHRRTMTVQAYIAVR